MSRVCAVVVTYNRPDLLLENINALIEQTLKLQTLIVVDNFSSVDTLSKLCDSGYIPSYSNEFILKGGEIQNIIYDHENNLINFILLRLDANIGGAGGFNKGIRYFYTKTSDDLVWIMDDDTIPFNNSLEELLNGYHDLVRGNYNPGFLCSRVLETNFVHGNLPDLVTGRDIFKYSTINSQLLNVMRCSFVSVLFTRIAIKTCGLPMKEFFIWHDDFEYTNRVAERFDNAICLSSQVLHKRILSTVEENITDANYFKYKYGFRNEAFLVMEKFAWGSFIRLLVRHFRQIFFKSRIDYISKIKLLLSSLSGLLFFRPKREYFNKNILN